MNELKTKENLVKLLFGGNNDKLPAGVVVYDTHGIERDLKESDPRTWLGEKSLQNRTIGILDYWLKSATPPGSGPF